MATQICNHCGVIDGIDPVSGLCTPCKNNQSRLDARPKCDACGHHFAEGQKHRMDDDGFVGCFPCFPVSNAPEDSNRFMRGPCWSPPASQGE